MLLRTSKRAGTVCLTFDDGPSELLTPRLLDLLDASRVRGTFFLLGRNAVLRPSIVERMIADGHEVGCHTHHHLNAWKVSPRRAAADIEAGYESLARWVPADGMFRPPYGKVTPLTWWQLRRRGAPTVMWTHDSGDTHEVLPSSGDAIAERVVKDGGGVVLLHDFDRTVDEKARSEYVLDFVARLVRRASSAGLGFVTVGSILAGSSAEGGAPSARAHSHG
jgi:peptidoglycan/xylan/chitin deacetylase (PgdA/CDA1 family)